MIEKYESLPMVFVPCLVRRALGGSDHGRPPWGAPHPRPFFGLVTGTVVLLVLAFLADDRLDHRPMRSAEPRDPI